MSVCDITCRLFDPMMSQMRGDATKAVVDARGKKMRNRVGVRGERSPVACTAVLDGAAGSGLAMPEPKVKKDLTGRQE
jgi:hypothetical protein